MKFKEYLKEGFANHSGYKTQTFDIEGEKVVVKAITRKANLMGFTCKFKDGSEVKIFNVLKAEEAAKKAIEKRKKSLNEEWTQEGPDEYSIDQKGRKGTPITCPSCDKPLTIDKFESIWGDKQVEALKGKCRYCKAVLILKR